ncbi:malignant T-cell-amplified sequence 1 homolog [Olea europaea subsp. europaea]|uniref:Malignant T-cell-amplified sequence 1 homolog n=1 Tax=Olea europaea subsp. europaea TaxID=158383 RepID=A0A8S0UFU2_OLEEU|nr:malignant T-cell-amplified sequence 1 homolog [Olea europaea subsp. europaea]
MFKKFSSEEVSAQNQVKASVQRKIRQSIAEEYPGLEPVLDDLLPKKSPLIVAKCPNHLNLVLVNNVPLFFNIRDGPYMPTLRLLHQYPNVMKKLQVDRGAIKFVISGANIMCPGLTSPGGALDNEVEAETPVAIMAEGKQHALAIGFTKMSAKDIRNVNKGIGVDNMHYLNDGLWKPIKVVTRRSERRGVSAHSGVIVAALCDQLFGDDAIVAECAEVCKSRFVGACGDVRIFGDDSVGGGSGGSDGVVQTVMVAFFCVFGDGSGSGCVDFVGVGVGVGGGSGGGDEVMVVTSDGGGNGVGCYLFRFLIRR